MLKILTLLTIIYSSIYANAYLKSYLTDIKKQPSITYKTLIDKYLYYLDEFSKGEAISEIDGEFIDRYEMNQIAINIPKIKKCELIVTTKEYAIGLYSDGFDKYAVIFNSDAKVKKIILLEHSFGNIYFNITRNYNLTISSNIIFYIQETRFDRAQIDKPAYLSYTNLYTVTVHPNGTLTKRKATLNELLNNADKKLNTYYKKLKTKLSKQQQKDLRNIQRIWLKYIDKKCSFLVNREDCLYKVKSIRANELKALYDNF